MASIFVARAPHAAVASVELSLVASHVFDVTADAHDGATTGGDFRVQGDAFILRTYDRIYLWQRAVVEPWSSAFARSPCLLVDDLFPLVEPQGESLAFGAGGEEIFIATEMSWAPMGKEALYRFVREP